MTKDLKFLNESWTLEPPLDLTIYVWQMLLPWVTKLNFSSLADQNNIVIVLSQLNFWPRKFCHSVLIYLEYNSFFIVENVGF